MIQWHKQVIIRGGGGDIGSWIVTQKISLVLICAIKRLNILGFHYSSNAISDTSQAKILNKPCFVVHRPPNAPANLLDSLNDMVGNIVTQVNNDVIILGDFNCDMSPSKRDNSSNSLQTIMSGLNFYQLIDIPTRETLSSKSIIDLIFCTDPDNHNTTGVFTTSFSDHYLVFTVYSMF